MPLPDGDLLLTFTSWGNTHSSKPERDVQVLVNDTRVGTLEFTSGKRINGKFLVPQVVARGGGKDDAGNDIVMIKFLVPRTGAPGTNSEPVTLKLRLESLRFAPLKAIAAEMAVRTGRRSEPTVSEPLAAPSAANS